MSSWTIRPAVVGDLPALIDLYDELAEGDPARGPGDAEGAASALEGVLAEDGHHLYVVLDGGADADVVAAAELVVVANLTHHGRPWAAIENVIVRRGARERGVGSELLVRLLDLARAKGCYKVQLLSGKQRRNAHRLYRRLGFEPVAEGFKLYFDDTRTWRTDEPPR